MRTCTYRLFHAQIHLSRSRSDLPVLRAWRITIELPSESDAVSFDKAGANRRPNIRHEIKLKLWVKSAGVCSFKGCNTPLHFDELTFKEANFSNIAHIIGYSEDGPRGKNFLPLNSRDGYENLILLCAKCHHLVDSKANERSYPVELLQQYKREHEEKIEFLREIIKRDEKTQLVRCRANILNEVVQISFGEMTEAISPRFPVSRRTIDIDMTKAPGSDTSIYWESKKDEISLKIGKAQESGGAECELNHLSVFPMGPIPLLMHLGNCLSNKIVTDLYQRHRDTETWKWKEASPPVFFDFLQPEVKPSEEVVLIMSLSGKIHRESIPKELLQNCVYEITLKALSPSPNFLGNKQTLEHFKIIYRDTISKIKIDNPYLKRINVLPAIPAPLAVLCGRELLHKSDPVIHVYDFNREKLGFSFALEINDGCR